MPSFWNTEELLVINKPSGLAVHGGSGLDFGLIEVLRATFPQARFLELVHRLDRDTSGLIMVARKRSALRWLQEQIRSHLRSRGASPLGPRADRRGLGSRRRRPPSGNH